MSVLEELIQIRDDLIAEDRRDTMRVLARTLYYKIAPRVARGDRFVLFENESTINQFCHANNLDIRAVKWVLGAMRDEGILEPQVTPVTITPLGVEKICFE